MEKTMFVAFSHTLTKEQIRDAKASLDVTRIVTLEEANPELQAQFSQVDPNATTQQVKELAREVVDLAHSHSAEIFFCTGEPLVMLWANLLASRTLDAHFFMGQENAPVEVKGMRCVQSTTERKSEEITLPDGTVKKTQIFKHVQWRDLF